MMAAHDLAALFRNDFPAYVAHVNQSLTLLDRMLAMRETREDDAELRAWVAGVDYFDAFRDRMAREAVDALMLLGVEHPADMFRLGVVATRVWLLEVASDTAIATIPKFATWRGAAIFTPQSPAGEWYLALHVSHLADGVRIERRKRRFGIGVTTAADFEEARNRCEIPNEQWARICKRAEWVLR